MPPTETTPLEVSASSTEESPSDNNTRTTPNRGDEYYSPLAVTLIFLVPAIGGFLFGYDIAATSFVLQALTNQTNTNTWSAVIASSAVWQGIVVSLSSLGAWVSSAYVFSLTIGRRTELQIGALLYIAGATLEGSVAHEHGTNIIVKILALSLFLAGRLTYGLGIGITMHAAPTYLGEMCPVSIRGWMVSLKEACIVLGMVFGYSIGSVAANHHWQRIYTSTLPFSCFMLLLSMFLIPESGRYLLLKNPVKYEQQALLSFEYVFPRGPMAQQQVKEIQASIVLQQQQQQQTEATLMSWRQWLQPQYRLPLTAGLGLVVLQQVTGQPSVLSYATQILEQAGLMKSAAIPIALFKLVATIYAASVVEKFGRVKLLFSGCSLMLVALLALSFYFVRGSQTDDDGSHEIAKYLVLVALFMYIGGYQVGFGPVTWLMTSEVFPLAIRGQAVALAVQMNFLLNAVVQFGVPVLQQAIGLAWTFGIFALLDLYSLYFIRTSVPETKGLSLEQIERLFQEPSASSPDEEDGDDDGGNNEGTIMREPLLANV